jgi:hypothetical protein
MAGLVEYRGLIESRKSISVRDIHRQSQDDGKDMGAKVFV